MKVGAGDFIKIEYTGKVAGTGKTFDTTFEDEAKRSGIYNEGRKYGPIIAVVGKKALIPGLDEALDGMNIGDSKEIELNPEKAFGQKDPSKVAIISINEFKKNNVKPAVGMPVNMDGQVGRVKSVSGGRVMVDMNSPLAGETLKYSLKVVEKLDSEQKKIEAIAQEAGIKCDAKFSNGTAEITIPATVVKDAQYFVDKSRVIASVFALIDSVKSIKIVELHEKTG